MSARHTESSKKGTLPEVDTKLSLGSQVIQSGSQLSGSKRQRSRPSTAKPLGENKILSLNSSQRGQSQMMMNVQEHLPEINASTSEHKGRTHNPTQIKIDLEKTTPNEALRSSSVQGLAPIQIVNDKGSRFGFEVLDSSPYAGDHTKQPSMPKSVLFEDFANANSDLQFHLPQKLEELDATQVNFSRQAAISYDRRTSGIMINKSSSQLAQQDLQMIQSKINNLVIPTAGTSPIKDPKTESVDPQKKFQTKKQSEVSMTVKSGTVSSPRHKPKENQQTSRKALQMNLQQSHNPKKYVRKTTKNMFKEREMSDHEVIELLTEVCETRVIYVSETPNDLDSTDPLDSFLMALLQINNENAIDSSSLKVQQVHLATGDRTTICRQILSSLVQHQYKEFLLNDSVEFFSESLQKMVKVNETNKLMTTVIEQLEETKQELTMKMFDYQKKLTETSTSLLKLRQTSYENTKIIDGLKKQLEFKKAECESLTYMLQNNQPSVSIQQSLKLDSDPMTPTKTLTPLESEFFPEELPGQESAEVDSLQGQIQKQQIQLKQYLQRMQQQQTAIESKDRLITHLESNIASFLVEREENIIRLKSEIVLLQTKVNNGEVAFKERLLQMRGRVETEEKKKIQSQIDEFNTTIDSLKNMGVDQLSRIQRLQADYSELKSEFKNYRSEKTHQEEVRESYLKETECKYQFLNQNHQETKTKLTDHIEELQSKLKVKQNEAEVSLLRLKYLRQCTDTLQKQKIFVLETLQKSKQELRFNMAQIQESMINQNKSKSYLISVEKAIKQTQGMQEMGVNALKNVEQIITFFKTEKMYELVFQVEPPAIQKIEETVATLDAKVIPAVNISPPVSPTPSSKPEVNSVQLVQKMLDSLKNKIDVPVNFRPKKIPTGQQAKKIVKNEEYYLDHCPLEMVSILLKFLIEQLAQLEIVQSVEQIPFSISRLLFLANSKSDLQLEKELFEIFLQPTKKLLDDEYQQLQDQILTHNSLMVFKDNGATENKLAPLKSEVVKKEHLKTETQESHRSASRTKTYNVLSMEAFESKVDGDTVHNIEAQENLIGELREIKRQLEFQLSKAKITIEESKLKSKEIQKALACKVVQLEEAIETMEADHEERLDQAEAGYRGEIERMKEGCRKREEVLIENLKNFQSRNLELEGTLQVAAQGSDLKQKKIITPKGSAMAQSVGILKNSMAMSLQKKLTSKQAVEEVVQGLSRDYSDQLEQLTSKLENMKDNIATFINIRESTRAIMSLAFQASESNQAMINEEIIGFYLEKVFQLPKIKFNFLNTFDFVQDQSSKKKEQVVMTQVTFEIMMEYRTIETQAASVRAAITDGSSLLYDLSPLYICFNFGQSGLATHHKIRDFYLIKKQGMQLGNSEFLVSLLRHNVNLFVFMVVAFDITDGNEYVVELLEQDIYQLSLGNLGLLEDDESLELQDLVLDNLNLVELGNGQKTLTCEQKLYFNPIWQEAFVPRIYQDKRSATGKYDLTFKETIIKKSVYHQSTVREGLLSQNTRQQEHLTQEKPKNQLYSEVECQTESRVSGFGQFEQVYSGIQQVSEYVQVKVEIQESIQGNVQMMQFQETKSSRVAKFCIFKEQLKGSSTVTSNDLDEQDQALLNPNSKQSFYCHSQCILIDEGHIILVCVEKIQNEGLQIRLHDLKMCSSEQFFLIKKSNGQLSKLPSQADASKLLVQEDFRNIVYDLSFAYIPTDAKSDIVLQTINYAHEKMMAEGKDPEKAELFVQNSSEAKQLKKIDALSVQALLSDHTIYARHSNHTEYQKAMQERGMLLYRDVTILRMCDFSLSEEDIRQGRFNEKKSLISMYLKDKQINIEVFFYSDDQRMSIIGSVDALDLLQDDPHRVPFADRVNLISQMLERLFVNEEQGGKYSLKVESDMPPMSQILLQRQSEPGFEKMGLQPRMSPLQLETLKRTQINVQKNYEDKLLEFQSEKDKYIENDRAKYFSIYAIVGQKANNVPAGANSGLTLQLSIYVLLKKEKKGKNITKRLNTYGKTQMQIENQKLEAFMDDHVEIDQIYIETRDPATGNLINTLIDKRKLVQILVCDFTIDWVELLMNWRSQLISYIQQNIEIDREKSLITIRNKSDTSNLLASYCKSVVGSKMEHRGNSAIIDSFPDESRELLNRQLLLNQEVDFTEYSYDIKLYKISRKSAYGEGVLTVGIETLAYHLEIFNINEPDVVFKFRLPVTASKSHDPVSVFIEVMNLTDFANDKQAINDNVEQINEQIRDEKDRLEVLEKNQNESEISERSCVMKDFDRKSDAKVKVSKFQELFKRYVDNQLVLVVQENKFPALISFALLEPSSRLCQKCSFEPANEISQPASFSLIDAGNLENFFSQVYDSTSDDYHPSFEGTQEQEIDWNSIQDTKPYQLMEEVFLGPEFKLQIQKHRGKFIIQVKDPKKEKILNSRFGTDQKGDDADKSQKKGTSVVNSEDDQDGVEAIYNVSTLHGKYFQDPDCLSDSIHILDIRIKDVYKIQMISKVLYCNDSSGQPDRCLIFLIETNRTMISVTIKNLLTSKTIFCLKLNHAENQQMIMPLQVIKSLSEVRPSVLDAIGLLNTAHIAEEAARRHNKPNHTDDHTGPCTTHQQRFHQRNLNEKRKIGLHRKVLFDDVLEKLIVITAEIEIQMGIQKCEPGWLDQDIAFFTFKVFEPERDFSESVTMNLSELINERELASLNRRDLLKLKQVAKSLLEDRAVIQRVEESSYSPKVSKAGYFLEFKAVSVKEGNNLSRQKSQVSQSNKPQEQQQRNSDQKDRPDSVISLGSQLKNYHNSVILELDEVSDH